MSTHIPRKKPLQKGKKVIVLGLIGLKMEKLSSKNENVLNNSQTSERDLVIDILKKKISDL